MTKHINMTQGKPLQLLFAFALPLMFGNVFQQLYTVVDTAIVGRGVGMDALAALGTVDWLNWLLLGVAQGLTQGFSVRIAQKFGQGDMKGLRQTAGQSALLSAVIALVCTFAIQLVLPYVLVLLRVPEDLRAMASLYTRVLMAGLPAVVFYNYCAGVLRAIGDSRTPLIAMVVAALTNILLDCVAVFWLGWGIVGAAAATVFAQLLSGVICACHIRKIPGLRFGKPQLVLAAKDCLDLMRIGTPIAAKNVIIALGGMVIQSIVNGFDMSFIAGFTATNKLYGLLECSAIALGASFTTFGSQNFGAGDYKRVRRGVNVAMVLAVSVACVLAAIVLPLRYYLPQIFIDMSEPGAADAVDVAAKYLRNMILSMPILYLVYVHRNNLQAIGNTVWSLVSGIAEAASRVIMAKFFLAAAGVEILFYVEPVAWLMAWVFVLFPYYYYQRRLLPVAPR